MPIDIKCERLIDLNDVHKFLASRPNKATLWRWHARGVGGVRLETLRQGRKRVTSAEALQRFLDRLARDGHAPVSQDESTAAAEETLKRAGF